MSAILRPLRTLFLASFTFAGGCIVVAQTNPFVGTWKFVPERSHFDRTAPKDIKLRFLIDKDQLREEEEIALELGNWSVRSCSAPLCRPCNYFPPQRQAHGNYGFGFPLADAPLAALAVDDTGSVVTAIFENRAEFLGETVEIVGDQMTAQEFAQIMSRVLRRSVTYSHIPRDTYAALGFPNARDLADMFEFLRVHLPSRRMEIAQCRRLYPSMQTFESWVQANTGGFAAVLAA